MGVLEKRRRGVVVEARDADYSRVLLPWCHLLFLTQLPLLLLLSFFFRHCPSSVLTSETDTQSLFEPTSTFYFLQCMCALIPNNWTLFYVIVTKFVYYFYNQFLSCLLIFRFFFSFL